MAARKKSKKQARNRVSGKINKKAEPKWWKLTPSERRSVVIRAIYDVLIAGSIHLPLYLGNILSLAVAKRDISITTGPLAGEYSPNPLTSHSKEEVRSIADAITGGVELALALKESESELSFLWDRIEGDDAFKELAISLARSDNPRQWESAREPLARYIAEKMREHLEEVVAHSPGHPRPREGVRL